MKIALNGCILSEPRTTEQFLALAARHGCEGADLSLEQITALDPLDPVGAGQALFARFGVYPSAWGLPESFRGAQADFEAGRQGFAEQARLAAALGAPRMYTWLAPAVPDPLAFRETVGARLGEMARLAAPHGVRLGLEWVGPRHARQGEGLRPFLWRMDQMLEWIAEIGEPNLGLLVDSFHWHNAEHTVAELEALRAEQVVHAHINDAPDRPLDEQHDFQRLYPGEGIIDLAGFLGALARIGYRDYVSVEVLNPDLRAQVPDEEAVARAVGGARRVLDRLG